MTDVDTYAFKDNTGHISRIHVTPNHLFYVKNKHAFIPIKDITDTDKLVGQNTHHNLIVQLVCQNGRHNHCGSPYTNAYRPIPVYNLEIYQHHTYRVGTQNIMVHNVCLQQAIAKYRVKKSEFMEIYQDAMDINFAREFSSTCPISRAKDLHLKASSLLVITLDPETLDTFLVEGFYDREAIKTQIRHQTESLWRNFNTPGKYSDDEKQMIEEGVARLASEWNMPISGNNRTALTKMSLLSSYDVSERFGGPLRSQRGGRPIEVFIDGKNIISRTMDLAKEEIYHVPPRP